MPAVAIAMTDNKLCVGVIAGAHGVRGDVRIRSFTAEPGDLVAYGPLSDAAGRRQFRITLLGEVRGQLRAHVEGIEDRDAAEALAGVELYVDRSALPEPEEEEYYHSDLIGLRAELDDGSPFGTVRALYDFGAGDMIEFALAEGGIAILPFTRAVVPEVDLAGGRLVVRPPEEVEAKPGGAADGRDDR